MSAADAIRAPGGGQAARAAVLAAVAVWCAIALGGGGMDYGNGLGGPGALGAALGPALLAPLAAAAVWAARGRLPRRGPAVVAVGAAAGSVLLGAASLSWAADDSLAWLAANRTVVALAALVLGVVAGVAVPRATELFPPVLALAAAVPVTVALATVALPTLLGEDGALGRLQQPIGYANALALVAAMVLPGALAWPATERLARLGVLAAPLAAAAVVCAVLALSRGGVAALTLAAVLTLALGPRPRRAVSVLVAAVAGAAPAVAVGLGSSSLTTDGLATGDRAGAGAVFGLVTLGGLAAAAALRPLIEARLPHGPRIRRRGRVAAAVAAAVIVAMPLAVIARDADAITGCDRGAVANDAGRFTQISANQRGAWWCAAARGWAAAPVVGNGAGSWPVVELRHRRDGDDQLLARGDPHQVWLSEASSGGVLGLALLLGVWGSLAWAVVRLRSRVPGAVVAVPAAALLQAQADWVLTWPVVAVPVAAAIGVLVARASTRRGAARPPGLLAETALAIGLAACAVGAIASGALPWLSDRTVRAGEDALVRGDVAGALADAADARRLNPTSVRPLFLRARAWTTAGDDAAALAELHRATRVQPDVAQTWRRLARTLGDDPEATAAWRRVLRLDPYARDARAALALPPDGPLPAGADAAVSAARRGGT